MTPDELRAQGFTVKFYHLRRWVTVKPVVMATIGEVVKDDYDPQDDRKMSLSKDNVRLAHGNSIVNLVDTYNKRVGRVKSFGRAWADFQKKLPDEVSVVH